MLCCLLLSCSHNYTPDFHTPISECCLPLLTICRLYLTLITFFCQFSFSVGGSIPSRKATYGSSATTDAGGVSVSVLDPLGRAAAEGALGSFSKVTKCDK